MTGTNRIEFFRNALSICARHGRSPQAPITVRGEQVPLRLILKTLNGGQPLPAITEAEARALARESGQFTYMEILTGLGGRRAAARRSQARRRQRATRARSPRQ